jgi:glycerol kinase
MAGAVIEWLQKKMGLIKTPADVDRLAESVESTEDVYLVPAFTGLGAPYWDAEARGTLTGVTQDTGRAHVVRAGAEAIAYQTRDVLEAMEADAGVRIESLAVDGGVTKSKFVMQFLADILGIPVRRNKESDITARGAGYLAGKAVGFWKSAEEIRALPDEQDVFEPKIDPEIREALYKGWKDAVARARSSL